VPDNKTWPEAMAYTEKFIRRWKGDALITAAVAPHAPYTVNTEHLNQVRTLAERLDSPIIIHLAEAPTETEFMAKTYNSRPAAYLEKINFLSPRVLAAHVVHVNDEEIAVLKRREVGVGHCPQSNMKLASGNAPIPAMLKAGVRVGLGTDGAASNHDLSLWEEIDTAAKLHKLITMDPTAVPAQQALAMATIGGARAIHQEKEVGSLEAGKRADVIVVDLSAPHLVPLYNFYSHLVYAAKASDVSDTIVNGRVLMRDRKVLTLDVRQVLADARAMAEKVRAAVK